MSSNNAPIQFLDELPGHGRSDKNARFFKALRTNPGKWAAIPDQDRLTIHAKNSLGQRIKKGAVAGIGFPGEFNAAVREGILYARYMGDRS